MPTETKVCRICKEAKPLSDFGRHCSAKDGLRGECKSCHNADVKKWRDNNPEIKAATHAKWCKANKEHLREYRRKRRAAKRQEAPK